MYNGIVTEFLQTAKPNRLSNGTSLSEALFYMELRGRSNACDIGRSPKLLKNNRIKLSPSVTFIFGHGHERSSVMKDKTVWQAKLSRLV